MTERDDLERLKAQLVEHSKMDERNAVSLKEYLDALIRDLRRDTFRELAIAEEARKTALTAVAEQANTHSSNHDREHAAHKEIHLVEEKHLNEARRIVDERLKTLNELRSEVTQDRALLMPRKEHAALMAGLRDQLEAKIKAVETGQDALTSRLDLTTGDALGAAKSQERLRSTILVAIGVMGLIVSIIILLANGKLGGG